MTSEPKKSKAKRPKSLITVGWREWLELPDLNIPPFKAKVDTGARTSALHAVNVKVVDNKVRFSVQSVMNEGKHTKLELPLQDMRRVRSSNGKSELRPVIRTTLALGGKRWLIDITLTRRDSMEFRMLLGREALRKHAVVDVSRSYALGTPFKMTADKTAETAETTGSPERDTDLQDIKKSNTKEST